MKALLYREIQGLESLTGSLDAPKDLSRALQEIVDSVTRWSGADRVTAIQFDWDAREVRHFLRGGTGWADVITTIGFEELLAGLSGWALRSGEVVVSPKDLPDPRESPEVQRRRRETHCGSILVAPVGPQDRRLGTITVINRPDQRDFTAQDAEDLALYAQFAGWVIRAAEDRQQTLKAQAEAQTAIRSKTNFLSNLSHELRTPLNGILGFSHLLEASELDPVQNTMVQTILESGQRLLATVDNLLELAQMEAGQFHLESAPFSPRAVLESIVSKHSEVSRQKALQWEVRTSEDLPVVLEGDAVRLGQAWNHILSNAVKFTEHGSIRVSLESRRTSRGRSELILNVDDTGIGLSYEKSGQWFMPFHQEDGSLTRKFGGTGLGLALCDRIVRKMGGGLSLWGEPGKGTKVRVWVDLSLGQEARQRLTRGFRVLLQDPDPVSSLVVVKLLEKAGHRVDFVTSLAEAATRIENGLYDVLMTEAPPQDPDSWSAILDAKREVPLHLVGLYPLGSPTTVSGIPWTTTLMKPVTHHNLEAVLSRCRAVEDL